MATARGSVAATLIIGQILLTATGCVSARTTGSRPSQSPGGGVAVRVFADDGARKAGTVGPGGLLGELERRDGATWVPVFRSLDPSWTVTGLRPGTYRLRFPARLDNAGNVVMMDEKVVKVGVEEGRITEAEVVLRHVNPALVAAGVVVAVAAAVVLADYISDHGLPEPPLPPPDVLEAAFYITWDVASAATWHGVGDRLPPSVTSHFPAQGALVAARRPKVIFALSEPLEPTALTSGAVTVLGEASGLAEGDVSYDGAHWWVVWTPRRDLAAGDTFHVTLAADGLEDRGGNELKTPATFTFTTAPERSGR